MPAASTTVHRVHAACWRDLVDGQVRHARKKPLWFSAMTGAAIIGGVVYASWRGLLLFAWGGPAFVV